MVELDLVKGIAPSVTLDPSSRMQARGSLDAAIVGEIRRKQPASRSRKRRGLLVAAAAVAIALGAAVVPWDGSGRPRLPSAGALVLPDGSRLTRSVLSRYALDGRLPELRERLQEYGVELRVTRQAVDPTVAGRLLGWAFYPSGPQDGAEPFDENWYIDSADAGALLTVQIGREAEEGETASTEGMSVFQIHPELCEAFDYSDMAATHRNLKALGFDVEWSLLSGNPDDPDYDSRGLGISQEPPSSGSIYAQFQGTEKSEYAADRYRGITIEVVPEGEGASQRISYTSHC